MSDGQRLLAGVELASAGAPAVASYSVAWISKEPLRLTAAASESV